MWDWTRGRSTGSSRVALVYRGPAAGEECSEAVAALLRSSTWDFDVQFVGPRGTRELSAASLRTAALYAQPGGGSLKKAYRKMKGDAEDIRSYVATGGRYLGFCLGGYLAGATPGYSLLPGDTARYIDSPGATVRHARDTVVPVLWRGQPRHLYFQDGPRFILDAGGVGAQTQVLATYGNGTIAALVAPYGRGRIAVVGPHPEATADWYEDSDRANPDGICSDLGLDLLDALMADEMSPRENCR